MFKSIEWQMKKFPEETFTIIDDDFVAVIYGKDSKNNNGLNGHISDFIDDTNAVIEVYEERKLNVAANLIRFFNYNLDDDFSINQMIKYNILYNENFHKYKNDLEKYLSLI